jgi:hypothetical protein
LAMCTVTLLRSRCFEARVGWTNRKGRFIIIWTNRKGRFIIIWTNRKGRFIIISLCTPRPELTSSTFLCLQRLANAATSSAAQQPAVATHASPVAMCWWRATAFSRLLPGEDQSRAR